MHSQVETTEIGRRLAALRRYQGLRQIDLEKDSGVNQVTISRIESGFITDPRVGVLQNLAQALGITLGQLIGDEPIFNDERG